VEAIQSCYQVEDLYLNNIYIKEREATIARDTFQEAILIEEKDELARVPRLSLSEQAQGDIILKTSEQIWLKEKY
jgi:hypothetical protein